MFLGPIPTTTPINVVSKMTSSGMVFWDNAAIGFELTYSVLIAGPEGGPTGSDLFLRLSKTGTVSGQFSSQFKKTEFLTPKDNTTDKLKLSGAVT